MCQQDACNQASRYYENDEFNNLLKVVPNGKTKPEAKVLNSVFAPEEYLSEMDDDVLSVLILSDDLTGGEARDCDVLKAWMNINSCSVPDFKRYSDKIVFEVGKSSNARLIKSYGQNRVVVDDGFASLFISQAGKTPELASVLIGLITNEYDRDIIDRDLEKYCKHSLLTINVGDFFGTAKEPVEFTSKVDCIKAVYDATNGEYIPIGCIRGQYCSLFTTGKQIDDMLFKYVPHIYDGILVSMDGGILAMEGKEEDPYGSIYDCVDKMKMKPNDYLVVIKNSTDM